MGVFKRRSEAQAAQKQAEAAMPGAYQSQYKDRIDQTLAALSGTQSSSALDDLTEKAYQQYRQRNTGYARDAMENAAAGAAALSGGYGSSYAKSAAKQQFQQEMGDLDNALPSVRSEALNQYQTRQSGLAQMLNALQNREAVDQNEYDGSVTSAQSWRDYKQSRAQQAQQEVSDFWNNLWQDVKLAGNTLMTGYDAYKGYAAQKQQATAQAIQYAVGLKQQGADDAAAAVLDAYGVDRNLLNNYSGQTPITWKDQLSGITAASGLMGNGDQAGAYSYLNVLGLPNDTVDSYDTIANRAFDEYAAKQTLSKALSGSSRSGSGSGSRKSSSSGSKSSGGWTTSQLRSAAKEFRSMTPDDPLYNYYKQTLQSYGWISPDWTGSTQTSETTGSQSGLRAGALSSLELSRKYPLPTGLSERKSTSSTTTKTASQSPRAETAANLARNYSRKGYSSWAIMNNMHQNGYTDEEIARALEAAGVN